MSNNYTKVNNTTLSGSQLLSNLSGDDVRALNFQQALNREDVVTANSANAVDLTVDHFIQAATGGLSVNGTDSVSATLNLGEDLPSQASGYVRLFNLSSSLVERRLLNFVTAVGSSGPVSLSNSDATSNSVVVRVNNGSGAGSSALVAPGTLPGVQRLVEVYATNTSPSSAVVNFNILG